MSNKWIQSITIAGLCLLAASASASDQHTKPSGIEEFSGTYYAHFGLGHSDLLLASDGTFQLDQQGDIPVAGYQPSRGSFTFVNRLLKLTPQGRRSQQEMRINAKKYCAVNWGRRRLLIAEDHMLRFCNEVNSGTSRLNEAGSWNEYYLHEGDDKFPLPKQIPDVPDKWKGYLLSKVVHGHVIRMIGKKIAIIDVGSSDGLKPGMEVFAEKSGASLTVIACDVHSARLRLYEDPPPTAGVIVIKPPVPILPVPAVHLKVGTSVTSR